MTGFSDKDIESMSGQMNRDLGPNREALLREAMNDPDFSGRIAALEKTINVLCHILVDHGTISINDARKILGISEDGG